MIRKERSSLVWHDMFVSRGASRSRLAADDLAYHGASYSIPQPSLSSEWSVKIVMVAGACRRLFSCLADEPIDPHE